MKKRSLFSRVLSGLAAAALAATVCFGDGIFRNLAASAADDPVVFFHHEQVVPFQGGKRRRFSSL